MKRLLSLLTVLCLLALPALADTTVCDFDDFTWEIDNEMVGSITEKAENVTYITLYPTYTEEKAFNSSVNCVWMTTQIDMTELTENDAKLLAQNVLDGTVEEYKTRGYDTKAGSVISATVMDNDEWGKRVLTAIFTYQIDLTQTGEFVELSVMQVYVGGTFGAYIFTVTADDMAEDFIACAGLLDQIVWVN